MSLTPNQNAIDDKNKVREIVMEALSEMMDKDGMSKALQNCGYNGGEGVSLPRFFIFP